MKKIDKLGKIVVPLSLRKKYGLTEGTDIEFLDGGDGITIRACEAFCRICHKEIFNGAQLPLCKDCIIEVVKEYNKKI